MRAAALGKGFGSKRDHIEAALRKALPVADVSWWRTAPGGGALTLARLMLTQPLLVIAEAPSPDALPAALYRALFPSSRLLLCAAAAPTTWSTRFALARADDVLADDVLADDDLADDDLADGERVARAFERLRLSQAPSQLKPLPPDLDLFLAGPVERDAHAAHRLLHVGPLSPDSGASDVLAALATWAEHNPARRVEICWAGNGDLAGVLAAQPLPANLEQCFLGELDRPGLAEAFAGFGIMIVALGDGEARPPVLEAIAAGLVLLGDRRAAAIRGIARAGAPIWAFNALDAHDMAAALTLAFEASPGELDALREAGRALVRSVCLQTEQPARETIAAVLPPTRIAPDEAYP